MKTFRHLYDSIITFENVYKAYLKARRGKRYRDYTLDFSDDVESELWSIIGDLRDKTYRPGVYHTFKVYEPKERLICAAPFRDRVVHHALCNVIEPLYDRTFIHDSYACRTGKGTHRALFRAWDFMRKNQYVLKCDIRKYFPSIDQAVLKSIIRKKLACADTLWLCDTIIDHGNVVSDVQGKGLPIGNLTSQFFANLYLNELDHYVKETLRASCYLRYMDDFMIFHDSKDELQRCRSELSHFLSTIMLELKPGKSEIFPVKNGFEFLGFFNRTDNVRVKRANVRRFVGRLKLMRSQYFRGDIPLGKIGEAIRCWSAHAAYAASYRLRRSLLKGFAV